MKSMSKKVLFLRTKYYFYLLKQRQLYVFNFLNWRLVNKFDFWVQLFFVKNKISKVILKYTPGLMIKYYEKIKAYKKAHPWKYIVIRFSVFSSMKLAGGGFFVTLIIWPPFLYKLGKGAYYISQMSPSDILMGLADLNWKKVFLGGTFILTVVFVYNNLNFIIEKFLVICGYIFNWLKNFFEIEKPTIVEIIEKPTSMEIKKIFYFLINPKGSWEVPVEIKNQDYLKTKFKIDLNNFCEPIFDELIATNTKVDSSYADLMKASEEDYSDSSSESSEVKYTITTKEKEDYSDSLSEDSDDDKIIAQSIEVESNIDPFIVPVIVSAKSIIIEENPIIELEGDFSIKEHPIVEEVSVIEKPSSSDDEGLYSEEHPYSTQKYYGSVEVPVLSDVTPVNNPNVIIIEKKQQIIINPFEDLFNYIKCLYKEDIVEESLKNPVIIEENPIIELEGDFSIKEHPIVEEVSVIEKHTIPKFVIIDNPYKNSVEKIVKNIEKMPDSTITPNLTLNECIESDNDDMPWLESEEIEAFSEKYKNSLRLRHTFELDLAKANGWLEEEIISLVKAHKEALTADISLIWYKIQEDNENLCLWRAKAEAASSQLNNMVKVVDQDRVIWTEHELNMIEQAYKIKLNFASIIKIEGKGLTIICDKDDDFLKFMEKCIEKNTPLDQLKNYVEIYNQDRVDDKGILVNQVKSEIKTQIKMADPILFKEKSFILKRYALEMAEARRIGLSQRLLKYKLYNDIAICNGPDVKTPRTDFLTFQRKTQLNNEFLQACSDPKSKIYNIIKKC
ncbi:MAG TPA: hypothetical protein VN854_00350 [Mycoplasmatales bacterium]|nr:hypothetical protein [Mycoplasmatales bacterium]